MDEFLVLYDANKSNNPEYPYWGLQCWLSIKVGTKINKTTNEISEYAVKQNGNKKQPNKWIVQAQKTQTSSHSFLPSSKRVDRRLMQIRACTVTL